MKIPLWNRKMRTRLTIWGKLLVILILFLLFYIWMRNIHPFLSKNKPVQADILVAEGYIPDYAMKDVIKEFNKNHYHILVVSGNPVDYGFYYTKFGNTADAGRVTLIKLGMDSTKVFSAPAPYSKRDRTYAAALSVKHFMDSIRVKSKAINLYSFGCHARRSWLLYKKAFGHEYQVGVLCSYKNTYDPNRWWRWSDGVREITDESVAFIYASIFFRK
ncbi:MAG: hypothetical protein M0R21_03435 [Lentimicrobiaceae bacterium]|nr:hypothetical protein [Lentimicrobiaceae bacterium]